MTTAEARARFEEALTIYGERCITSGTILEYRTAVPAPRTGLWWRRGAWK